MLRQVARENNRYCGLKENGGRSASTAMQTGFKALPEAHPHRGHVDHPGKRYSYQAHDEPEKQMRDKIHVVKIGIRLFSSEVKK